MRVFCYAEDVKRINDTVNTHALKRITDMKIEGVEGIHLN